MNGPAAECGRFPAALFACGSRFYKTGVYEKNENTILNSCPFVFHLEHLLMRSFSKLLYRCQSQ
jgi:hypothetical protein